MFVRRSAMILAGGEAKRADGRAKYFFSYKGCSFIERLVTVFSGIVDEIVIVAKNENQAQHFINLPSFVHVTWDNESFLGPIGGISAGIEEISGDVVFIAACDMPTINRDVVQYLFENLGEYEVIIPEWENGMMEPLHAVYRTDAVRRYLTQKRKASLYEMIHSLNAQKINPESLRRFDAELETFRNINTLSELLAMGAEICYQEKSSKK